MKKVVLITGASRGIGAETARVFHEKGFCVVVDYLKSKKEAEELVQELNTKRKDSAVSFKADVANFASVQKLVQATLNCFGQIDVLINNAGIAQRKMLIDMTQKDIDDMVNTNLKGVLYTSRFVLEHMASRKSGSVVSVSSVLGVVGCSCEAHYSATKGGIIALTKALAKEYGVFGMRINCISPGVVLTDMLAGLTPAELEELAKETLIGRNASPQEIAKEIYHLAVEAEYITGQNIMIDGGLLI